MLQFTINTGGDTRNILTQSDFAATAFECIGGLLEATVNTTGGGLSGNGASDNPISVVISPDAGNGLVQNANGLFVPSFTGFDITDGTTTETIAEGDTITFTVADASLDATVSATDTVAYGVNISATAGNQLTLNGDGLFVAPLATPSGSWNDATNTLDLTFADGSVVAVPIVDDVANFIHTHTITDGTTSFDVTNGDTTTFEGTGQANVTVTAATETVTIDVPFPTEIAACPSGYFTGA